MSDTVAYRFDGDLYPATPEGEQNLLEAISTALDTEAWSDPDMKDATDDERQEAVSMAWDGTNRGMPFWDNIMAIMQHAPYEIDVKRLTLEELTEDERDGL